MYCGIVLTGDVAEATAIAFIDDDTVTTTSVHDDEEIMELLEERRPTVIALNAPPERVDETGFREGDEDLIDEGHAMLPQGMRDTALLERAAFLTRSVRRTGFGQVIEVDPDIARQELDIEGDDGLGDYGYETGDIHTVDEFHAVVLALTAKLFDHDQYSDYGIIVPDLDAESGGAA